MAVFQVSGPGAASSGQRGQRGAIMFGGQGRTSPPPPPPGGAILGLSNFGRMLASIPGGLFQLGRNIVIPWIPGQQEGEEKIGEFWKQFGTGVTRSLVNTAFDVADLPTGGLASKAGQALIPGEAFDPQGLYNRIGSEGLLNVLAEDIGNVALGAGAVATVPRLAARAAAGAGRGAVSEAANVARGLSPFAEGAARLPPTVFRGTGAAGALEQTALKIGRYAHPYREFIFPAGRKALAGGEFRSPFGRAAAAAAEPGLAPPPAPPSPTVPVAPPTPPVAPVAAPPVRTLSDAAVAWEAGPVVVAARQALDVVDDVADARFVAPDGTLLGKRGIGESSSGEAMHRSLTEQFGTNLPGARDAGLVQIRADPTSKTTTAMGHPDQPLTPEQVRAITRAARETGAEYVMGKAGGQPIKSLEQLVESEMAGLSDEALWERTRPHLQELPDDIPAEQVGPYSFEGPDGRMYRIPADDVDKQYNLAGSLTAYRLPELRREGLESMAAQFEKLHPEVVNLSERVAVPPAPPAVAGVTPISPGVPPPPLPPTPTGGPFAEAFRPPTPRAPTGRAFQWKGLPGGKPLVQMFDVGKLHKRFRALTEADARGATFAIQQAIVPFLDRFTELTDKLTRAERDLVLGEALRTSGAFGDVLGPQGEAVLRQAQIGRGKGRKVRSEARKEFRALDADKQAQVSAALLDPSVKSGLEAMREAYRGQHSTIVNKVVKESMYGEAGLEAAARESWTVGDTPRQEAIRLQAEQELAELGGQQSFFGAGGSAGRAVGPGPQERIRAIDLEKQRRPSRQTVAPRLQPLAMALRDIRTELGRAYRKTGMTKEAVETALDADGWTWDALTTKMQDGGFDPVHFRDFTDDQVRSLIRGSLANTGSITKAGTRMVRTGAAAKKASHSLEAVAAGFVELSRELRQTEFLRGLTESGIIHRVPEDGIVPPGMKRFRTDPEGMQRLMGGELDEAGDWMIPKGVADYLRVLNKDWSHPLLSGVQRITNPWRSLILTASPKWYFNNTIGNAIMASAHGVKFSDWQKAWNQKGFDIGDIFKDAWYRRYPEVDPRLKRSSLAYEGVQETTVGGVLPPGKGVIRRPFREARAAGRGVIPAGTDTLKVVAERAQRMNEVVDEVARVALYEKELRTALRSGANYDDAVEAAVTKATKGLVDYADQTAVERQVVRTFIPFYAWQAGIMKMATRLAIDHPARVRVTMLLGQVNNELFQEEEALLPDYLRGTVDLGPLGMVRTARMNPFADSTGILDPDKLKDSINPFIDLLLGRMYRQDPTGGFGPKEVNQFGQAVPRVNIGPGRVLSDVFGGAPVARLGGGILGIGEAQERQQQPIPQQVLSFLGPTMTDEAKLAEARARKARAIQQVTTGAPLPAQPKKTGGLFSISGAGAKPASRQQASGLRSPVTFAGALRTDRTR